MTRVDTPPVVLIYGVLGLIPFMAPVLFSLWVPAHGAFLSVIALGYGALILSFLGGARWAFEVAKPAPGFGTVTLSMLPTLAGLGLLLAPWLARPVQLTAMAVLLAAQFFWDVRSRGLPGWYPRLRAMLTVVAVGALIVMAVIVANAARVPVEMI